MDADHGCCRSCALNPPAPSSSPPSPPPATSSSPPPASSSSQPPACEDDDATMQGATVDSDPDGAGYTCAQILALGACSQQIIDLGWCGCSCPPPTSSSSSAACEDDDATMQASTPGQGPDGAGFTCAGILEVGACSQVVDLGICGCSCPPPSSSPPPPSPSACEDDDAAMQAATPNQGPDGAGFTCADILAVGACSQVSGMGICGCSCPAAEAGPPPPPEPTMCVDGQSSSGSMHADDPECCDVPGASELVFLPLAFQSH